MRAKALAPATSKPAALSIKRWRGLFWILAPLLLWLAVRTLDFRTLLRALKELGGLEIAALLLVNLGVLLALSGRWWIILGGFAGRQRLLHVSAYRLAAFAISYFTPGPQFGGEPLQAYLVWRRDGLDPASAIASVILDKAIELMVNFSALIVGIIVLLQLPLKLPAAVPVLLAPLLLLGLPLIYLVVVARGGTPLSRVAARFSLGIPGRFELADLTGVLDRAEGQAGRYWAGRKRRLMGALTWSVISWLILMFEYALLANFLGFEFHIGEILAILTAARLAFLLPFPGGLGALELGQAVAVSSLGYPAEAGVALALVIRARDVLFGLFGLVLGSYLLKDPCTVD